MSEYKGTEVDGGTCWKCGTKRETIAALLARIADLLAENEVMRESLNDCTAECKDYKESLELWR